MARPRLGPDRPMWQGLEGNERAYNRVHNGLVGIILDGVAGVSPELPGHGHRQIPPGEADEIIDRARRTLASFEQQTPPGGSRGRAYHWMTHHTSTLRKMLADAEAVRSGARPQKQTPESYDTLRKSLGAHESGGSWGIWDATREQWLPDAMRGAVDSSPANYRSKAAAERAAQEWRSLNPDDQFEVRPHGEGEGGRGVVRANVSAHRDPVDEQAATELVMFIENESDLSPDGPQGQGQSVRMNALRKWRNGTYDSTLGVKLFEYLAESGAKRYAKEFASPKEWNTMFNPATRHEAARQLEASFRNSAENGEYDRQASGTVRDYEAIDTHDRHIAGPFKSYGDAKNAAGTAGVVRFVPKGSKRATEVHASIAKRFHVGSRVMMSPDALENYGERWQGIGFIVTHVSTSHDDHPGYDSGAGSALYDLKIELSGEPFGNSLYDWELVPEPPSMKPRRKWKMEAPRQYSDISAAIDSWNRGDAYRDGSLQTLIDTGLVAKGRGGWAPTASGHRRGLSMDHMDHTGPREVRSPSRSAHHPTSRRR